MPLAATPFIDWSWISQNGGQILSDLGEHAELSFIAVGIGTLIGVPLSVLAWRSRLARSPITTLASVLYIIPSLAMFAILGPITGYFSTTTAEIALVSYTQLILIRNTLAGLAAVPEDARDAAKAMGFRPTRSLIGVELPLAVPYILAGIRVATVTVIGLVSVTALIGLGGLGQLFVAGLQGSDSGPFYTPILVGLVLSVALAAAADAALVVLERFLVPWSRVTRRSRTAETVAQAAPAAGPA